MKRTIVITGGAGFIGSHVVRLFVNKYPDYRIINVDKLTYAGNLANLRDIEAKPNYKFVKMDVCDFEAFYQLMQDEKVDGIIHLAAESHVDRSIKDPFTFARTNVMGTLSLLQAAKLYWEQFNYVMPETTGHAGGDDHVIPETTGQTGGDDHVIPETTGQTGGDDHVIPETTGQAGGDEHVMPDRDASVMPDSDRASAGIPCRFYHISTDEVYGALEFNGGLFTEQTKYDPHSPYSASKASSDHFVRAYHDTYGMPTIVTNCSNNYGPYQFPEKLIPLFINNIRHGKPLPVYGRGENVRDWLYVEDHARAIDLIFHEGRVAETYNIGGFNEWKNIDLIQVMIKTVDHLLGNPEGHSLGLITYVTDRPGHDARYAIDSTKLKKELGWEPSLQFEEGIEKTVRWYLENQDWMDHVTSGDYMNYYEEMYSKR